MAEFCPIHEKKHYPKMVSVNGGPQVKVADHEEHGRLIGAEVSECGEIIEAPAEPPAAVPVPQHASAPPSPPADPEEDDNPLGN